MFHEALVAQLRQTDLFYFLKIRELNDIFSHANEDLIDHVEMAENETRKAKTANFKILEKKLQ